MTLWHDQHEVLFEKLLDHEVAGAEREVEQGQIELPGCQLGLEAGRGPLDRHQPELRVAVSDCIHEPGDEPRSGGGDHAHPYGAADLVLAGGHIGDQSIELGQDAAGSGQYHHALLGQAAVAPVDHGSAQLTLEASHMGRDVRLHRAEVLGGSREGAVVADGGESL